MNAVAVMMWYENSRLKSMCDCRDGEMCFQAHMYNGTKCLLVDWSVDAAYNMVAACRLWHLLIWSFVCLHTFCISSSFFLHLVYVNFRKMKIQR